MDEKRKGEIALALLRYKVRREGVRLDLNLQREFGNIAKDTGIPINELKGFLRLFVEEMVREAFGN